MNIDGGYNYVGKSYMNLRKCMKKLLVKVNSKVKNAQAPNYSA